MNSDIKVTNIVGAPETVKYVHMGLPYLEKLNQYFNVGSPNDILKNIYPDTPNDKLTNNQIIERKRREKATELLMKDLWSNQLPPITSFNPAKYDIF